MLPIICFTCGELLSDKQLELEKFLEEIKSKPNDAHANVHQLLDQLDYCCKMRLISYLQKNEKPNL